MTCLWANSVGPIHAAPPAYSLGRRGGGGGEDGEWLTGIVGMDYWMHIGILFSCQEIYSTVRKSIPLTLPFFITVQEHNSGFRIHTPSQLSVKSNSSLSCTVCRCTRLISAMWCQTVITIIWCLFFKSLTYVFWSPLAVTCISKTEVIDPSLW